MGFTFQEYVELLLVGGAGFEPSVDDAITISEQVQVALEDQSVSVYEQVAISETNPTINFNCETNTFENIALSEYTNIQLSDLAPSVADSFILSEQNTSLLSDSTISASDNFALSEFINASATAEMSVFDNIVLSEQVSVVTSDHSISVFDNTIFNESPLPALSDLNILSDTQLDFLLLSEYVVVEFSPPEVNIFNNLSISDLPTVSIDNFTPNVVDQIGLIDIPIVSESDLTISKTDDILLSEDRTVSQELVSDYTINVSEDIGISDYLYQITVLDTHPINWVRSTPVYQGVSAEAHCHLDFGSLPSQGNFIVVLITGWVGTGSGSYNFEVTDNQGNTYTVVSFASGTPCKSAIAYAYNIGSPSGTFTITVESDYTYKYTVTASEWSGVAKLFDPFDAFKDQDGNSSSPVGVITYNSTVEHFEISFGLITADGTDSDISWAERYYRPILMAVNDGTNYNPAFAVYTQERGAATVYYEFEFEPGTHNYSASIASFRPEQFNPVATDNLGLSESVTVQFDQFNINVNDSITLSEDRNVVRESEGEWVVSVNDGIVLSELSTITLSDHTINTNDSFALSESIDKSLDINIDVFDNSAISESVSRQLDSYISISDNFSISEFINLVLSDSTINVSDNLALSDDITVSREAEGEYTISVFDNTRLSEDTPVSEETESTRAINVSDNTTLSDSISVLYDSYQININDQISLSEYTNAYPHQLFLSVSDNITLVDSVGLLVYGGELIPNKNDYVRLSEFVVVRFDTEFQGIVLRYLIKV